MPRPLFAAVHLACRPQVLAVLALCALSTLANVRPASAQPAEEPSFGLDLGLGNAPQAAPGLSSFETAGNQFLNVKAKVVGGPGGGTLQVTAVVESGHHIYSITQEAGGPQRTEIKVNPGGLYKQAGEFIARDKPHSYTDKEIFVGVKIEEHSGTVTWIAPITFAAGAKPEATPVEGVIKGQVCKDDGACFNFQIPFAATYEAPSQTPGEITIQNAKVLGEIGVAAAAPGTKIPLRLTIEPQAGWHAYKYSEQAVDENQFANRATIVAIEPPKGYFVQSTSAGSPEVSSADGLAYYEGPVTFTTMVDVPRDAKVGETVVISGIIGFQVCKSAASCDLPTAAQFTFALPIAAETAQGELPATFEKAKYGDAADAAMLASASRLDAVKFAGLIGAGLLGGLILNLMPCVLPVIGLKILSFVEQAHHDRKQVLALNLWYTAGLMAVFMVLATLSVLLNLGWGEQFTSTPFKIAMSGLVFAMALSFLGVWEIPIPGFVGSGRAVNAAQREGYAGAFAKGVLTTILATPCSAPFLGSVFGATLNQPGYVTYTLFASIGLGMASPYLLIGAQPQLIKFLPKPGAWMETFKQAMAFFLLGTVVFLFSSLSLEIVVPAFGLMVAIWAGCWWIGKTPLTAELPQKAIGWASGIVLAAALGYVSFYFFGPVQRVLPWREFSVAEVEKAKAEGKTVMVDFTANWCGNCKFNLKFAIDTEETLDVVKKHDVVPFLADWTDGNDEIRQYLNSLGSNSIPVLAIFPANDPGNPIVLRDVLKQQDVIDALQKAGASKPISSTASTQAPPLGSSTN